MSIFFGGKMAAPPNPVRAMGKEVRLAIRRMEREEAQARQQESVLLATIKKLASHGKVDACQGRAKELIRLRSHSKVLSQMRSQLTGLGQKLSVAESTSTIHDTLARTGKLLAGLNKTLAPKEIQRVLLDFQRQNTVFSDTQEILAETLEEAFEGEDEESNVDAAVCMVFQEIGLQAIPSVMRAPTMVAADDLDLERRLQLLRGAPAG